MNVNIIDQQTDLFIPSDLAKKLVNEVIKHEGENCHEVTVHFVDVTTIKQIHADYFNDPSQTDCISFPIDDKQEQLRVLGEIFVCPQTAIEYAKENGVSVYNETSLYIIHGLLHLMGYDDIAEEDEVIMRQAEQKHLSNLKRKGLLLCY